MESTPQVPTFLSQFELLSVRSLAVRSKDSLLALGQLANSKEALGGLQRLSLTFLANLRLADNLYVFLLLALADLAKRIAKLRPGHWLEACFESTTCYQETLASDH